jgi:hypothetical protein
MISRRLCVAFVCATLSVASAVAQTPTKEIHMFLPDHKGGLVFAPGDLRIEQGGLRPDGKQFTIKARGAEGIFFTAFIEVAPRRGSNADVRSDWWGGLKKNSKLPMKNIRLVDLPERAETRYLVEEFQGQKVNQRTVHAYYGGSEVWAEIHISQTPSTEAAEAAFDAILSRARMVAEIPYTSFDWFLIGSGAYRAKNYAKASDYYSRALELEKQAPQLQKPLNYVLIDNLGMSYGISGQLEKAKSVFEYGLTTDANYPLFYYNLACTYAEMKQMQPAMDNLKKAFDRRANVLKGETMPSPETDDSFQQFMKESTFRDFVKTLPRS